MRPYILLLNFIFAHQTQNRLKTILLVEDDPVLNRNIKEALTEEGMHVEVAFDGTIAERQLKNTHIDCIILDINLPGKNGYDICKDFRIHNKSTPILMLTAFSELEDKVTGYDSGADDYLTKPFYMKELILRINSLLKRVDSITGTNSSKVITADDIVIDTAQKKVSRQNKEVALTPREYQILIKLINRKGEVVPKAELVKEIWGNVVDANTNTIEVYINFLRNKLDKPFGKSSIKTKIGFGYYFETP